MTLPTREKSVSLLMFKGFVYFLSCTETFSLTIWCYDTALKMTAQCFMHSLSAFEAWLNTHLPEVAESLNHGASELELNQFASTLNVELPSDFLALYKWRNGQSEKVNTGPWFGLNFLPLAFAQSQCEMWRSILQDSSAESLIQPAKNMKSTPNRYVLKQYANPNWIPFAYDWGGNYLGIDLSPDEQGTRGQVINFGRDEERKIAVAPSITAFVDWMVAELQSGNFRIQVEEDGGRSFNTLRPQKNHFLDALAVMFPEEKPS
jgi:cell wall assembly regulator SMI1